MYILFLIEVIRTCKSFLKKLPPHPSTPKKRSRTNNKLTYVVNACNKVHQESVANAQTCYNVDLYQIDSNLWDRDLLWYIYLAYCFGFQWKQTRYVLLASGQLAAPSCALGLISVGAVSLNNANVCFIIIYIYTFLYIVRMVDDTMLSRPKCSAR